MQESIRFLQHQNIEDRFVLTPSSGEKDPLTSSWSVDTPGNLFVTITVFPVLLLQPVHTNVFSSTCLFQSRMLCLQHISRTSGLVHICMVGKTCSLTCVNSDIEVMCRADWDTDTHFFSFTAKFIITPTPSHLQNHWWTMKWSRRHCWPILLSSLNPSTLSENLCPFY